MSTSGLPDHVVNAVQIYNENIDDLKAARKIANGIAKKTNGALKIIKKYMVDAKMKELPLGESVIRYVKKDKVTVNQKNLEESPLIHEDAKKAFIKVCTEKVDTFPISN
ncbi:hypothetical protein OAM67_01115 [bacterium]|nr:hypothetical protein [bacterium]